MKRTEIPAKKNKYLLAFLLDKEDEFNCELKSEYTSMYTFFAVVGKLHLVGPTTEYKMLQTIVWERKPFARRGYE